MSPAANLAQALSLSRDITENDLITALHDLIASAVRENAPLFTLGRLYESIKFTETAHLLDSLLVVPLLLPVPHPAASSLLSLAVEHANAKEALIALQEALERVQAALQSDPEELNDPSVSRSLVYQLATLISLYSVVIPRLQKSPFTTVCVVARDLVLPIRLSVGVASEPSEGHVIIRAVSEFVCSVARRCFNDEAQSHECKPALRNLFEETITVNAPNFGPSTALRVFHKIFARYAHAIVGKQPLINVQKERELVTVALEAARVLCIPTSVVAVPKSSDCIPSLTTIILLAHSITLHGNPLPDPTLLVPLLPTLQAALRAPELTAVDESLALLLLFTRPLPEDNSRAPLSSMQQQTIRTPLPATFAFDLATIAVTHPDPSKRHIAFSLLGSMGLSPPDVKRFLAPPTPPQMRAAAVALVRRAVLEEIAKIPCARSDPHQTHNSGENSGAWTNKEWLDLLGSAIFKPDLDLLDIGEGAVDLVVECQWEVKRLVECLQLVYALVLRDVDNRTGIRDPNTIRGIESSLLNPLRAFLGHHGVGFGLQTPDMVIVSLSIALERVDSAIAKI